MNNVSVGLWRKNAESKSSIVQPVTQVGVTMLKVRPNGSRVCEQDNRTFPAMLQTQSEHTKHFSACAQKQKSNCSSEGHTWSGNSVLHNGQVETDFTLAVMTGCVFQVCA